MLSNTSRWLTYLLAAIYAVLGVLLFFLPESLAPVFAWKVTPFMTMTIGGWCIGNAWAAWVTARRWQWNLVYCSLFYLWIFGVGELLVLFNFRNALVLAHPIAWLYFISLLVNTVAAVIGVMEWLRIRPALAAPSPFTRLEYAAVLAFILFVGFLGLYGIIAQPGAPGTNGGIFPEIMSPFTLRSFGMFYLSLSLSTIPHLLNQNRNALLHYAYASYGLIIFITTAAFIYIHLFDFSAHPGGLAYFGAYLIVGIPLIFVFLRLGTGASLKAQAAH